MDLFHRAKAIRLRSHHNKFLHAEEDLKSVSQNRNGTNQKARWQIELLQHNPNLIRLKSCFGKFLSASNDPFLLGFTGHKVFQIPLSSDCVDSSVEWEPIRDGFQVKIKSFCGKFLRANGGIYPWRNSVTHDVPHLHRDWVLWDVDVVEVRVFVGGSLKDSLEVLKPGGLNQQSLSSSANTSPQKSFSSTSSGSPRTLNSRIIHYTVANNDGNVESDAEDFSFSFQGSSVEDLTQKLKEETDFGEIIVCSRNPVNGKLYPLRLQLPPNKNNMNFVVLLASSKAAKNLAKQESLL